jgi:hypothetical protein
VPKFKLSATAKTVEPNSKVVLEINDIVELILEGTYHNGTNKLINLSKASSMWGVWTKKFTKEYCKEYIHKNQRPEVPKISVIEETDSAVVSWDKRQDESFRKKAFAPTEFKKYLANGEKANDDVKLSAKTPDMENFGDYTVRLQDMSRSMMEAAMHFVSRSNSCI